MDNVKKYAGRNAILLPRASTEKQTTSVEDQIKQMKEFADQQGINVVGSVGRAGISGSKSWNRPDFDEVIRRKRTDNNFDILIVYDISRFSRAGIEVGLSEVNRFHREGIDLLTSSDLILDGEIGNFQFASYLMMAIGQAKSISKTTCRGRQSAIERETCLPSSITPYGVDRLISTPDKKPLHIVRNLPDGGQKVIDANDSSNILFTFPPGRSKDRPRYRKQKHYMVELCPGCEEHHENVIDIFRLHYLEGIGTYMIAKNLNQRGIRTCRNRIWSPTTISAILMQPAYFGYIVGYQSTKAIHYHASKDGPVEVEKDAYVRSGRYSPPTQVRPVADWMTIAQPLMDNYIPVGIRRAAMEQVKLRMHNSAENAANAKIDRKYRTRDRHRNSPYLLKGMMKEASMGFKMSGTGGPGKYRYYRITRAAAYPGSDLPEKKSVPARQIEETVVEALRQTLSSVGDYREMILQEAEQQRKASSVSRSTVDKLKRELQQIDQDCKDIHRTKATYGESMALTLIQENRTRQNEITQRLADAERLDEIWGKDLPSKVDEVARKLIEVSDWLVDGPAATTRRLLELFVAEVSVNTMTKEFQVAFRLPKAVYDDPKAVSLDAVTSCQNWNETNASFAFSLPSWIVSWDAATKEYGPPAIILPPPPLAPKPGSTMGTAYEVDDQGPLPDPEADQDEDSPNGFHSRGGSEVG